MGYGKYMPIHMALKKYGKDAFTFEVIHTCKDNKDMNYAEVYYINKHTSLAPYGYNIDFNVKHIQDNPYLIVGSNTPTAVQSIDSDPANADYKLSTRTRYPVELWYEIKKMYLDFKSPKEINKILDTMIPHRTMLSKLQVLGCDTSNKARNLFRGNKKFFVSTEEKKQIIKDYKLGLSTKELRLKYKRGGRTIIKVLVEFGLFVSQDKKICRTA